MSDQDHSKNGQINIKKRSIPDNRNTDTAFFRHNKLKILLSTRTFKLQMN